MNKKLVYPEFNSSVHIIEPFSVPYYWQDMISIDPGLNNPLSAHFYCLDPNGCIYVVAEHYEAGKDIDYHAKRINEIADGLNWWRSKNGKLDAFIDKAAGHRTLSGNKSVCELFYERNIITNPEVNTDIFSGITAVKRYLASTPPKILIFKNCVNMIREIKEYHYGERQYPTKMDDHAMDDLRHYIMSREVTL